MSLSFTYGRGRVRFVHMFNYPENLSREACEKWYLEEHVPAVRSLPGVVS